MLSKSRYCLFTQCPKCLWLRVNRPELAPEDPALAARMETGNAIGDMAMGLFGKFTEVTAYRPDGRLDLSRMITCTEELIRAGEEIICEASFSYKGNYCAVDILKKDKDGYAIYEVKSSTHAALIYATDIAYQKYVLEQCGVHVTGTYLVCINNEYVYDGALDIAKFFKIIDMADEVEGQYPSVKQNIVAAEQVLAGTEAPVCDLSVGCRSPYDCAFWDYCTAHLPKPSVFDLYRFTFEKALAYYQRGVVSFEDVLRDGEMKNSVRALQIHHELHECEPHVDKEGIRKYLDSLSFPLYFLDFETMQPVVPQFVGTRPYQQIPFQYSLHYVLEEEGDVFHKEFLAESGVDPRRALAEHLCADIPADACVLAYNKGFECARIRELASAFPDLAEHLLHIADNIEDLIDPFRAGYYYTRAINGSFSIKSVLPALYPDDPALDYHNLEGVHNGSEAMDIFPKIKDMPPEEREKARWNLLRYCELDTYAMVKVWQKLCHVCRETV